MSCDSDHVLALQLLRLQACRLQLHGPAPLSVLCVSYCASRSYTGCVQQLSCECCMPAPSNTCCCCCLLDCRWDYNIPGMVDAAKSLADLQAKGLIKQV
jgi:hypothetical protein